MSTEIPAGVDSLIAEIAADRVHGASWLARAALQAIARCIEQAPPEDSLARVVRACAERLIAARPGMAAVRTWVERATGEVEHLTRTIPDPARQRAEALQHINALIATAEEASQQSARNAAARLPPSSCILTASASGTVIAALRLAFRDGRLRRVLAAESRDALGHSYGRDVARALAADGVPVEIVADEDVVRRVAEADRVWIGADAVLSDGSVLNGMPSLLICRAARSVGRPIEVICESAKIDRTATMGTLVVPPGFDRIPGALIDLIITDQGTFPPDRLVEAEILSPDPDDSPPGLPPTLAEGQGSDETPARLVARIAERLIARGEQVAVAESSAGGRICDLLTDLPGSSSWFAGGMVVYSNASKERVAGLRAEILAQYGAVSPETALALAEGARGWFGCAWGVGETGIAGPQTGRRSAKPAGLGHVAVIGPPGRRRTVEIATGRERRSENKEAFAHAALRLLVQMLEEQA
ncbi:MAG: nicotinamide-nucleotide amidohydrolase family protein [Chloroflexi bacterium]|nr:nicotinamide-nucleotide amidohydrolase family protein [Chloroflexota bacterium]